LVPEFLGHLDLLGRLEYLECPVLLAFQKDLKSQWLQKGLEYLRGRELRHPIEKN
jgi:hypothetical protein